MGDGWRYYLPDSGETADEATPIPGLNFDPDDAVQGACEDEFNNRDGWERGETEFPLVVIDPDGTETRWTCWHEQTVKHRARPAT